MIKRIHTTLPEHIQLLIALLVFFMIRFPSLFEPNWYGDEGIYETIGLALRHGRLLYTGIFDNKPPLLYLTYALFSGNQFSVRLLSLIVGLCTVTVFFCLAKRLFQERRLPFILTLIFAIAFGLPLIEGNIANAENFMVLPILGAILLLYNTLSPKILKNRQGRLISLFLSGVLLSIATLFKIVGIFDLAACLLFLAAIHITSLRESVSKLRNALQMMILDLAPLVIGYALPLLITACYFVLHHALKPFLQATLLSNVGYVGYNNVFIIPQGLLILKLLILSLYLIVVLWKRAHLTRPVLFILIWLGFSVFNVFFSQRPYTHYALLAVPSLILALGTIFSKERAALATLSALSVLLIIGLHFGFYGRTLAYYGNFLTYMTGQKSTHDYQAFFDGNTPRDYAIVSFLETRSLTPHSVFVWGDSAEIYQMTGTIPPGKYTVAYHISQYKNAIPETAQALQKNSPTYIVVLPNAPKIPFGLTAYTPLITIEKTTIYERTD